MTSEPALLPSPTPAPARTGLQRLATEDQDTLRMLRRVAARCRATSRADLFEACALLGADRAATAPRFAEALLRTLDQGLGRPARIFKPGAGEVSFDERWLLSLIDAFRRNDEASATFLTASRLPRAARRSIGFLVRGLSLGLDAA